MAIIANVIKLDNLLGRIRIGTETGYIRRHLAFHYLRVRLFMMYISAYFPPNYTLLHTGQSGLDWSI